MTPYRKQFDRIAKEIAEELKVVTVAANTASQRGDVAIIDWMDAGEKLCKGLDAIRYMLYGLALDARQAEIAQRAINEAVEARREWNEKKASIVVLSDSGVKP